MNWETLPHIHVDSLETIDFNLNLETVACYRIFEYCEYCMANLQCWVPCVRLVGELQNAFEQPIQPHPAGTHRCEPPQSSLHAAQDGIQLGHEIYLVHKDSRGTMSRLAWLVRKKSNISNETNLMWPPVFSAPACISAGIGTTQRRIPGDWAYLGKLGRHWFHMSPPTFHTS